MEKIKKIKYLLYILISFAISKAFYDSSVIITIVLFFGLNTINLTSKEKYIVKKKKPTILYGIALAVCLIGGVLIVLGKNIILNDAITIIGALLFAPTISALLIFHVSNVIGFWKNDKSQSI